MIRRLAIAASCALSWGAACAHDLGSSPVHPVLDALSPTLHGIAIEVAETLAPQILIANPGPDTLTILDSSGRAFLRIGPGGLQADLNAEAWYKSLSNGYVPEPAAAKDPHSPPRWSLVNHARNVGWFDPRLAVAAHDPTSEMRRLDQPAATGTWQIPVLIGTQLAAITGHFQYVPPPDGAYVTRLSPPAGFPAGIHFTVSQGAIPAILLTDPGGHEITLIGLQGEDEVRIGSHGTTVNTASETWRHWSQTHRAQFDATPVAWMKISNGASYAWLEPRAGTSISGESHPDRRWTLPMRVDGAAYTIEGNAAWKRVETEAK